MRIFIFVRIILIPLSIGYESFIHADFIRASNLEQWSKALNFKILVEDFQILTVSLTGLKNKRQFSTSVSF